MTHRITRRRLITTALAAVGSPACLALTASQAHAVAYAPIVAAAGQVLSYIGSRGNSTSALLLANLTALTAAYEQTVAINKALQGLTIQIAALHEEVLKTPAKTVEEDLLNTLAGTRALVVEYIKGEAANDELGATIDPQKIYDRLKRIFEESFQVARARFLLHSSENSFVGLADVAVNAHFELDLIAALVDRSIKLDISEFGTGDLLSAAESYIQYFSRALEPNRPENISHLVDAAKSSLLQIEKDFGDDQPKPTKTFLGCEYVANTYLSDTTIWEVYDPPQGFFQAKYRIDFRRKFLVVEEKSDFYDLRTYNASVITEADSYEADIADDAFKNNRESVDFLLPGQCASIKFPRPLPRDAKFMNYAFLPSGFAEARERKFNELSPSHAEGALALLAATSLAEIAQHMIKNLSCTLEILRGDAACIDAS